MAKGESLTVYIGTRGLVDRIKAHCLKTGNNVSAWCANALLQAVSAAERGAAPVSVDVPPAPEPVLTKAEAKAKEKIGKSIDRLLDEQVVTLLQSKPNLLSELDPKVQAQLIAQRAPKPVAQDADMVANVLGLRAALEHLPDVEDLDAELAAAKTRNEELAAELATERARFRMMAAAVGSDGDRAGFAAAVDGFAVDVVRRVFDAAMNANTRGMAEGIDALRLRLVSRIFGDGFARTEDAPQTTGDTHDGRDRQHRQESQTHGTAPGAEGTRLHVRPDA